MPSWQGSLYATTAQYQKELADGLSRKNVFIAMLTENRRITTKAGQGGEGFKWNVEVTYPTTQNIEDGQMMQRPRKNFLRQASLDWAYYDNINTLTERDLLKNQGKEQMTNLLKTAVTNSNKGLRDSLGQDFYLDGNTTTLRLHGAETWAGAGTALGSTGAFNPSDEYASVSTVLGDLGGSAPTGQYPDATPTTPEYDAWSPLILSSTSTNFGSAGTWAANCLTILGKASAYTARNEGSVETVTMNAPYWHAVAQALESRERVMVEASEKIRKYGFTKVINYYGMDCVLDAWCPASRAYGFNWEMIELLSLFPSLFPPSEQEKFFMDRTTTIDSRMYGQLKFVNPRANFVIKELGT